MNILGISSKEKYILVIFSGHYYSKAFYNVYSKPCFLFVDPLK